MQAVLQHVRWRGFLDESAIRPPRRDRTTTQGRASMEPSTVGIIIVPLVARGSSAGSDLIGDRDRLPFPEARLPTD